MTLWKEMKEIGGMKLIRVLIQDQVLYLSLYERFYSLCFSPVYNSCRVILCTAANITASIGIKSLVGAYLVQVAGPSLSCILGSYLLIHIREAAEDRWNKGENDTWEPISEIIFGTG